MLISSFSIGLTLSPSRPIKKLKMEKEKKTISNSRPKNPKLYEDVRNSSNLWRSLRRLTHQFDFSNTVDDPIEIEEGSTYGEETSSEDNS